VFIIFVRLNAVSGYDIDENQADYYSNNYCRIGACGNLYATTGETGMVPILLFENQEARRIEGGAKRAADFRYTEIFRSG
jgi:hypothetical protein